MWERPYAKSVEVIRKPAAQGILNGLSYTPKKSYETICRLAAFLSGSVTRSDCFFTGRADNLSPTERIAKICLSFRVNGSPMFAYYLPTDVQSEWALDANFSATICGITAEEMNCPILIDLYDGTVYDVGADATRCGEFLTVGHLPLCDYPLILCNRDAVSVSEE